MDQIWFASLIFCFSIFNFMTSIDLYSGSYEDGIPAASFRYTP